MATPWTTASVADCLTPVPAAGKTKLQVRDYKPAGRFPVIDQGQERIAGWTDNESAVIKEPLPLIVFGDHTRAFKFIDEPFARGADGTQLLKPKPGIDPLFFFYACKAIDLPARGYNRHFTMLKEQPLSYPDETEQKAVGSVLRRVDFALEQQSVLLRNAQALNQAAMRELFTSGLRGEPQKETDNGLVPESWTPTPCEKIFKLTSGKTRPNDVQPFQSAEKSYPVLGGNGVMGYSASWNVDAPDIMVIGRVGEYCGAVHLASGKVWITDNALYTREWLSTEANPGFVRKFLEHYDLNRFKRMAGQPLVTQGMINEHSVPLPNPGEQDEIVTILDALDRKIDLHLHKRAVLDDLFKALLRKLMTGEIAIDELDLSALDRTPAPEGASA